MNMPEIIVNTDQDGNDYPVISYGNKDYVMKDGDSFEKISYDFSERLIISLCLSDITKCLMMILNLERK